jgi:hypothetical protein
MRLPAALAIKTESVFLQATVIQLIYYTLPLSQSTSYELCACRTSYRLPSPFMRGRLL